MFDGPRGNDGGPPRRWAWAAVLGLGALLVLATAVRLSADATGPPAKPPEKKAEADKPAPKQEAPAPEAAAADLMRAMQDVLLKAQANGAPNPDDLHRLMAQMLEMQQKQLQQLQAQQRQARRPGVGPQFPARPNPGAAGLRRGLGPRAPGLPLGRFPGGFGGMGPPADADGGFHVNAQLNAVTIDVDGSVSGGAVFVQRVAIEEGGKTQEFDSLDKVPAQYRATVRGVLERAARGRPIRGANP
jgi:hypothetical protein